MSRVRDILSLFDGLLASCILDVLSCLDTKQQLAGVQFEAGS